jgi:hypothetical protein
MEYIFYRSLQICELVKIGFREHFLRPYTVHGIHFLHKFTNLRICENGFSWIFREIVYCPDGVTGLVVEGLQELTARIAGQDEGGVHVHVTRPWLIQQLVAQDPGSILEPVERYIDWLRRTPSGM